MEQFHSKWNQQLTESVRRLEPVVSSEDDKDFSDEVWHFITCLQIPLLYFILSLVWCSWPYNLSCVFLKGLWPAPDNQMQKYTENRYANNQTTSLWTCQVL